MHALTSSIRINGIAQVRPASAESNAAYLTGRQCAEWNRHIEACQHRHGYPLHEYETCFTAFHRPPRK